jgi:drug/metabolite transporter (DMT)-like permease
MTDKTKNIYLLIISNTFFGFLPIVVKVANQSHYSGVEESFFRFVFGAAGVLFLWVTGLQKMTFSNKKALFWRGFFGALSIVGYFTALQTTTSGKGTLLNYTYILWTNVFAIMFFKHKAPKRFFWFLLLAAVGIELVLDVQWNSFNWGDAAGLFSGLTGGAAVLAMKECRKTDTALTVFSSFTIFSLVLSGALLVGGDFWGSALGHASTWIMPDAQGLLILLGIGAVSMIAQMLFTQAIGHASLALSTLFTLSVPVLAALFGWIFLQEPLTSHFLAGMSLVLTACGAMIWQENQKTS